PGYVTYSGMIAIGASPGETPASVTLSKAPMVDPPKTAETPETRPTSARTIGLIASAGVGVVAVGVTASFGIAAWTTEVRKPAVCTDAGCRDHARTLEDRR